MHPLQESSVANLQADVLLHADDGFNFTSPLPAGLFTPPKQPNNASAQRSSQVAHSPAVQVPSHSAQYSLFDQSRTRVSFSTTATPTSIFRRLKTSSPEDTTEQHSKYDSFAYTQNINPRGLPFANASASSGIPCAPVAHKRSRPVQRGIHPAEINKRITGARDSWQILDIVNTFGAEFDAVNVATALHRIAKQRPEDALHLINSNAFKQLVIMVDVQVRLDSSTDAGNASNIDDKQVNHTSALNNMTNATSMLPAIFPSGTLCPYVSNPQCVQHECFSSAG